MPKNHTCVNLVSCCAAQATAHDIEDHEETDERQADLDIFFVT